MNVADVVTRSDITMSVIPHPAFSSATQLPQKVDKNRWGQKLVDGQLATCCPTVEQMRLTSGLRRAAKPPDGVGYSLVWIPAPGCC